MFYTPRFSYSVLETGVRAGSLVVHAGVRAGVPGGVWGPGGCTGGYTGGVPSQPVHRARKTQSQRSGPGRPAGPGVVGTGSGRVSLGSVGPAPTLRARSVTPVPSLVQDRPYSRLWANKGEI